jgi:C-terminal processing protease CtpA/Prc
MRSRLAVLVFALILSLGVLAPPAGAQYTDPGTALFTEAYRVLRDEALGQPTPDVLLRGAEAGLRQVLREAGQSVDTLPPLTLTGDERADLEHIIQRIGQTQAAALARPSAALYGAVSGMVAALRDPNSAFFTPDAFAQFIRRTRGDDFVGVGIVIEERGGRVVINEVLENSPASEAGLRGGDVILAVDGMPTAGLPLDQVSQMIRGAEGTAVNLQIERSVPGTSA